MLAGRGSFMSSPITNPSTNYMSNVLDAVVACLDTKQPMRTAQILEKVRTNGTPASENDVDNAMATLAMSTRVHWNETGWCRRP
jgi:hypothetical protein